MRHPRPDGQDPYQEVLFSPRCLAGSNGTGEAGFAPVAHWPHHQIDDGPCQLLVTSPDQRVRIGWFGDDFELWKITAAQNALSAPRWTATCNHVTPAEIVAGLTTALARDYAETDPYESNARFLTNPSYRRTDTMQPLLDAGWTRAHSTELGTIEIIAPDQTGILIDNRRSRSDGEAVELLGRSARLEHPRGGPLLRPHTRPPDRRDRRRHDRPHPGRTRAPSAPPHDAAPGHPHPGQPDCRTAPPVPRAPRAPTPMDVRRTAVTQALHRAAHLPRTAADLRVMAARSRTATATRGRPSSPGPALRAKPLANLSVSRRSR